MYMVPHNAPAARAAATPRAACPAGACAADATASRAAPVHITAAPPSTATTRDQPAPRSSLKNTAPHRSEERRGGKEGGDGASQGRCMDEWGDVGVRGA